jgi:phospholipid/cholesterol/gamma-HCH transport system substrate-binding protein
MASRNLTEIAAGAVVLLVAGGFLFYAVANTGRGTVSGTHLFAKFDRIDGLAVGSDVRVAGVKVGSISGTGVDPKTFQATVNFTVQPSLRIPRDSSAEVTSDGLLGGKFIALVPGGDDKTLAEGGEVTITQSAVSLEQLLGKFIFSVSDLTGAVQKQMKENGQDPAAPPK